MVPKRWAKSDTLQISGEKHAGRVFRGFGAIVFLADALQQRHQQAGDNVAGGGIAAAGGRQHAVKK
ncbi:MAG: hypothetical protein LC725_11715 [Lentisphaerae bacterium]|nr:hypothetical protein [Lentisphaerota bacterium]